MSTLPIHLLMRKGILISSLLTAAALIAPAGAQALCEGEGASPSELTTQQARATLVCLINEQRQAAGVRKVRSDRRLERAAQRHSGAMDSSNFFSHGSPGGASPLTRVRSTGYLAGASRWGVGENIHWGSGSIGSPRATINRWMQSSTHRSTMLSGRYRQVGVGVAFGSPTGGGDGDSAIYTANFGHRK